jgi:hypothetical protein
LLKELIIINKKMTTALPLKNQSAYLHYCSEVRASIQQNNPGIKSVDIVKKQGEGWKSLSVADKQKYEEIAKTDKERYLKEKSDWTVSNPGVVIEKKVKAKRAKKVAAAAVEEEIVILDEELAQPPAPVVVPVPAPAAAAAVVAEPAVEVKKKAPNKFQNFCKVYRPKLKVEKPTLQPKEVLTELGVLWKALSVEEQEKYI